MFLGYLLNLLFRVLERIFGFVFSRSGLIVGCILAGLGLIGGGYWLWTNRLFWKASSISWQASSELWQAHAGRLEKDTVRLFAESAHYQQLNAKLDKQAAEAVATVLDYQLQLQQQVAVSDRNADLLSERDQKIQYWRGLVDNHTLPATYIGEGKLLAGGDSAVTNAGLKTVKRAAITETKLNKLETAYAVRQGQLTNANADRDDANRRAANAAESSLYAESVLLKEARTRRFLGFGRKKAALVHADSVRKIRQRPDAIRPLPSSDTISDLETYRNTPSRRGLAGKQ